MKFLVSLLLLVTTAGNALSEPYPCNLLSAEQLSEFGYANATARAVDASFKNAYIGIGSEPTGIACQLKKTNGDSYLPLIVSAPLTDSENARLTELFLIATRNASASEGELLPIENGICLSGSILNVQLSYCVGIRAKKALMVYLPPGFAGESRPASHALKNFNLIASKMQSQP